MINVYHWLKYNDKVSCPRITAIANSITVIPHGINENPDSITAIEVTLFLFIGVE